MFILLMINRNVFNTVSCGTFYGVSCGTFMFHVERKVERELFSRTYCYNVMLTGRDLCEWGIEKGGG